MKCACCGIELAQNPSEPVRVETTDGKAFLVCGVVGAAWWESNDVIRACLQRYSDRLKARTEASNPQV